MEGKSNLEMIIQALTVLDRCVSFEQFKHFNYNYLDKKSGHGSLLEAIFNSVINNVKTMELNQYILNTFNCFRKSKTKLSFDFLGWKNLEWKDQRPRLALFHFLDGKYDSYSWYIQDRIVDENDMEIEFDCCWESSWLISPTSIQAEQKIFHHESISKYDVVLRHHSYR